MRQIDDPVRLRRRAANLERESAAAPARESTLAFLRGILEEVRFALDSPLEERGFEPPVPLAKRAGLSGRNGKCRRGENSRLESVVYRTRTEGSNPPSSSGESGEIHERACGAEVWTHPVHRKPAMKLVPRPGFVSIDRSAPGDPRSDF